MTDTKNMVLEGFRENTMTKEQLLALKTQMNAKALAKGEHVQGFVLQPTL